MGLSAVLVVAGCGARGGVDGEDAATKDGDAADTTPPACEVAALQYGDVCFYAYSVEGIGYDHPLDLDGDPGDELVAVEDGVVSIHKWNGDGFVTVGESELPGEVVASINAGVVAGEFDDVPGLDLIVSESGEWAALYHLDAAGTPMFVASTAMSEKTTSAHGFGGAAAIGPDDMGRWRVVAHFDNEEYADADLIAVWEVQGTTLVDERLDLPTDACEFLGCADGDFNADGRQDAVCTLMEYCADPAPEEEIVHVVLLAQANGSVSVKAYPTSLGPSSFHVGDLDGDGTSDLVQALAYRLANGLGGLEPAVLGDLPPSPELSWKVATVGDIDGDGDNEFVVGERGEGLVFHDRVGDSAAFDRLTLTAHEFGFLLRRVVDVNGDAIADVPVKNNVLLVSEPAA